LSGAALAKLYDRLSTQERLIAYLAARDRGDETEARRLLYSAPNHTYHFADFMWPNIVLQMLSLTYLMEQLDHLAVYWYARGDWRTGMHVGGWRTKTTAGRTGF